MKEWLYFGWTPEEISSSGIIFFIFFGSVALGIQGWKIWKNKSGLSVSVAWTFIFFFMFLTYPIYGVEKDNSLLTWQGVFRILFYLPILFGLYRFKGFTKKELIFARILFLMIFIMVEYPSTGEAVYTGLNFLGVFGVFMQGWAMQKTNKTGTVSLTLLIAYSLNAGLWTWNTYGNDFVLFWTSALFLFAYAYTITIWTKIRFCELRVK